MKVIDKQIEHKTKDPNIERRQAIVAQINANNRLEGISPCEEGSLGNQLENQWINGDITAKQAREILRKRYGLR